MNPLADEIAILTHWVDVLERLEPPSSPSCFEFALTIAEEIARIHTMIDQKNAQYEREASHDN